MIRTQTTLHTIDLDSLELVSGGLKWGPDSPRSKNVLDCRGPTCLDWKGEVDERATRQHKRGIGHEIKPLPKGDGGGLGTPRAPG